MNIEATIIVMVYKNLDQVRQTLDSIKKQTYSNYEVIVSDDGSPNYTQEDFDKITEQYKNEFTYFKLINNGINRGTVKHFNSLIKQAKGTIICPLSSGDQFYNENSLQEIMNAFDQEDKLIYTSKRMIKKENNIESKDNVIIIGNKDYIENTNRRIMQKNIEDLTIVDCYKFEDICNNMSEVADKYDFNLNTNGLQ